MLFRKNSQGGIQMKKLQDKLKAIIKSLSSLSNQVEKLSKQASKIKPAKKATAKKTVAKKAVAKKAPAKRAVAKKAVAKKTPAKKKAAKKAPAKKAVAKKAKAVKTVTVLDSVLGAIKRSKKGATIATVKAKTQLGAKQLSNALYKLTTKGVIVAKARGLYVAK